MPNNLWNLSKILQSPEMTKEDVFALKVKMFASLQDLISLNPESFLVIFIDDVQYLDVQSLEMLQMLIENDHVRLVCAGNFLHESSYDIRYKIALCERVRMIELDALEKNESVEYIRHILEYPIGDLPVDLLDFTHKFCGNNPGLLQIAVNDLKSRGVVCVEKGKMQFLPQRLPADEMTYQSIYCDEVLKFSTNEQSVLMIGSAFARIFPRNLLVKVLENPSEVSLAKAFVNLFDANIFACGTKYLKGLTLDENITECICCIDDTVIEEFNNQTSCVIPRYAFCKLVYFKNNYIRKILLDLMEPSEKEQIHEQVFKFLEENEQTCSTCSTNNLIPLFQKETFSKFLQGFNIPKIVYNSNNDISNLEKEPEYCKNVIRRELKKSEESKKNIQYNTKNDVTLKTRCVDLNLCNCIDIILRINEYLTNLSGETGSEHKRIYFLVQKAEILMKLCEFTDAFAKLNDVQQYLSTKNDCLSKNSAYNISDTVQFLLSARTMRLTAEIHQKTSNFNEAMRCIRSILELYQQKSSLDACSTKKSSSFIEKIISRTVLRSYRTQRSEHAVIFRKELSLCYRLVSGLMRTSQRQASLLSAMHSYQLTTHNNIVESLKTHINTLRVCSSEANQEINTKIIQDSFVFFSKIRHSLNFETLLLLNALTVDIFELTVLNGQIHTGILIGYNVINALLQQGCYDLYVDVIATLCSCLLAVQRVKDAVYLIKSVYNLALCVNDEYLLVYYAFCLELCVETGFILEPTEKILDFANFSRLSSSFSNANVISPRISQLSNADGTVSTLTQTSQLSTVTEMSKTSLGTVTNDVYMSKSSLFRKLTPVEYKFLILLYQFYLRTNRYKEAVRIKRYIGDVYVENTSFVVISNILRYVECLLVSFARKLSDSGDFASEKDLCRRYLSNLKSVSQHWEFIQPRYLHFKAYFCQLTNKKQSVRKVLADASDVALKHCNVLEISWILCNSNAWGAFLARNEHQEISWEESDKYNATEWSQIMFPLPSFT